MKGLSHNIIDMIFEECTLEDIENCSKFWPSVVAGYTSRHAGDNITEIGLKAMKYNELIVRLNKLSNTRERFTFCKPCNLVYNYIMQEFCCYTCKIVQCRKSCKTLTFTINLDNRGNFEIYCKKCLFDKMATDSNFKTICNSNLNRFHCLLCNKNQLQDNYSSGYYTFSCEFCDKRGICQNCFSFEHYYDSKLKKYFYYNEIDDKFEFVNEKKPHHKFYKEFNICDICCQTKVYEHPIYREEFFRIKTELKQKKVEIQKDE